MSKLPVKKLRVGHVVKGHGEILRITDRANLQREIVFRGNTQTFLSEDEVEVHMYLYIVDGRVEDVYGNHVPYGRWVNRHLDGELALKINVSGS